MEKQETYTTSILHLIWPSQKQGNLPSRHYAGDKIVIVIGSHIGFLYRVWNTYREIRWTYGGV